MTDPRTHAVVIAGGGPTGLTLAIELAIAGVDVAIVERRADQHVAGSRAGGLQSRTLELFDQRGLAERFIALGKVMQINGFAMQPLDLSDFPTRFNHGLALSQEPIERVLAEHAAGLGVRWYRSTEVSSFAQDDDGVDVALGDGTALRARWLVGADGGRSLVRKQAGIEFAGVDAQVSWLIAEAAFAEAPALGLRPGPRGNSGMSPLDDGRVRVVLVEPEVRSGEPSFDELRAGLVALYGTDFGVQPPTWLSRFTDQTRQATTYRVGRVLIAGDAAHIHSPVGGQGLNLGVHDAMNLGWKLGLVVNGHAPTSLLDSYTQERHPPAARALQTTMAQTALSRGDDRTAAARDVVAALVAVPDARRRLAGELSGLDVRYDLGGIHPLAGRRVPDRDLVVAGNARRLFGFLHHGHGVLVTLTPTTTTMGAAVVAGFANRVEHVVATSDGPWSLPVIGDVEPPAALLVRPDGYVAWVGNDEGAGLGDALTMWFGPPWP